MDLATYVLHYTTRYNLQRDIKLNTHNIIHDIITNNLQIPCINIMNYTISRMYNTVQTSKKIFVDPFTIPERVSE